MDWIAVDKNLPEDNLDVLVLCNTYDPKSLLSQGTVKWIFMGYFYRKKGWKIYFCDVNEVTHWMPLPLLPKDL